MSDMNWSECERKYDRTCDGCLNFDNREALYCQYLLSELPGTMHDCQAWESKAQADVGHNYVHSTVVRRFDDLDRKHDHLVKEVAKQIADILSRLEEAGLDELQDNLDTTNDKVDYLLNRVPRDNELNDIHQRIDIIMNRLDNMGDVNRRCKAIDEALHRLQTERHHYGPGCDEDGWPLKDPTFVSKDSQPGITTTGGVLHGVGSD